MPSSYRDCFVTRPTMLKSRADLCSSRASPKAVVVVAPGAAPHATKTGTSAVAAAAASDAAALAHRRSLLAAACLATCSSLLVLPTAAVGAGRRSLQQDARLAPLQQWWQQLVALLRPQLSDGFAPSLVFYGPGELLPSGAPGDPALEYDRRQAGRCGPFSSGFAQPYACCPETPAGLPDSEEARQCCRHFAYCVPRSRYAFAALDRQSAVVASPRLALAPTETWRGVLLHEMGHCVDFFAFPQRYRLPQEPPPRSAAAAALLTAIDREEADAELRADRMSNALLAPLLGNKMCYDSRTHIQSLVPAETECRLAEDGDSSGGLSGTPTFTQHFPHPPVRA